MALNQFTDREAIEECVTLRDRLPLATGSTLPERWREKDALAQIINLATRYVEGRDE